LKELDETAYFTENQLWIIAHHTQAVSC